MTTDITELAQRMKAAAEKLDADQWQTRKGFSGIEVIVKGSLEKGTGCVSFQPVAAEIADTKTARAIALFNPANIRVLLEALEATEAKANGLANTLRVVNAANAELLEALEKAQEDGNEYAASERAVVVNNVALQDEIYGLKARIAELESRTVTVKLPRWLVKDAIAVYDRDEIEDALTAAGIKWEAE